MTCNKTGIFIGLDYRALPLSNLHAIVYLFFLILVKIYQHQYNSKTEEITEDIHHKHSVLLFDSTIFRCGSMDTSAGTQ